MKRALDLFCKAGGATKGLQQAGYYVIGVDNEPQPRYCGDEFIQADIMGLSIHNFPLLYKVDLLWASPMCQHHTWAARRWNKTWPNQIPFVRELFHSVQSMGIDMDWIIENVVGAPLINPKRLCGQMFGLKVIRHRLFEINFALPYGLPHHPKCSGLIASGQAYTVAGHGAESKSYKYVDWAEAMGIDWMTKQELTQAIPPAYSKWLAEQLTRYDE